MTTKTETMSKGAATSNPSSVDPRVDKIEEYLTKLSKFLNRYDWDSDPVRPKEHGGGNKPGSNPPPWPP